MASENRVTRGHHALENSPSTPWFRKEAGSAIVRCPFTLAANFDARWEEADQWGRTTPGPGTG